MAEVASIEPYFRQRAQNQNERAVDGMNLELVRLGTFQTWPRWAPILPSRLARGGFFYTGQRDETECFSCHCKLSQWHDGDRPEDRHLRNSRDCDFMNGRTTQNIPLPRPRDQSDRGPNNRAPGSAQNAQRMASDSAVQSLPISSDVPRSVLNPEYERESARLATFSKFPVTCYVSAEELAQAGFIYLGHSDRVQCAFCKGVLKNWVPGDRAWQEHQRHFPYCPFMQNPLSTRSVPLDPAPAPAPAPSGNPSQQQNAQILNGPLHALGIATDRPKHPAFALEKMRHDTFKDWPSRVRQTPSQLAAAGFFYIGHEDSVKCFWCDGGLRNWEPGDDPWVEHARWFPKCGHVKAKKASGLSSRASRGISRPVEVRGTRNVPWIRTKSPPVLTTLMCHASSKWASSAILYGTSSSTCCRRASAPVKVAVVVFIPAYRSCWINVLSSPTPRLPISRCPRFRQKHPWRLSPRPSPSPHPRPPSLPSQPH